MSAIPSRIRADTSLRLQCACTLLVTIGAAYVSYWHGHDFALRYGADKTTAALWPLVVDGLLLTSTIELWKTHDDGAAGQWKAWLSFMLGIALSLCANIASAPELNIFSIAVAACPPLALLLSVELLNQALKRRRTETSNDTDHEADENPSPEPHLLDSSETSPSSEQSETGAEVPAPHAVASKVPGHHTTSADSDLEPPHGDDDPLREEAYRLDAEHWNLHQRPISADTLRRKLSIGSTRARTLTRNIRQQHQPGAVLAAVE